MPVVQPAWFVPCRFPHAGSGPGVGRSRASTQAEAVGFREAHVHSRAMRRGEWGTRKRQWHARGGEPGILQDARKM